MERSWGENGGEGIGELTSPLVDVLGCEGFGEGLSPLLIVSEVRAKRRGSGGAGPDSGRKDK